jgi:hypothetical protein
VDTYLRSGTNAYKPPLPYTPGQDAAGVVTAVGDAVTTVAVSRGRCCRCRCRRVMDVMDACRAGAMMHPRSATACTRPSPSPGHTPRRACSPQPRYTHCPHPFHSQRYDICRVCARARVRVSMSMSTCLCVCPCPCPRACARPSVVYVPPSSSTFLSSRRRLCPHAKTCERPACPRKR